MSVPVTISGTVINLPSSGAEPNWAEAWIQFAQTVSTALASFVGTYDVPPQIYTNNANVITNQILPNLSFPTSNVQGALIPYSVLRTSGGSGSETIAETGELFLNYNSTAGTGLKWSVSREYVGDALVTFSVSDTGQISFSTSSMTGSSSFTCLVSYQGKAILQTV